VECARRLSALRPGVFDRALFLRGAAAALLAAADDECACAAADPPLPGAPAALEPAGSEEPPPPPRGFEFTEAWCEGNLGDWRRLVVPLLAGRPGLRVLEVGAYEGRFSVWLLQNLATHESSRLTVVDPWEALHPPFGACRRRFFRNIAAAGAAHRVTAIQDFSERALTRMLVAGAAAAPPAAGVDTAASEHAVAAGAAVAAEPGRLDLIYVDGCGWTRSACGWTCWRTR